MLERVSVNDLTNRTKALFETRAIFATETRLCLLTSLRYSSGEIEIA